MCQTMDRIGVATRQEEERHTRVGIQVSEISLLTSELKLVNYLLGLASLFVLWCSPGCLEAENLRRELTPKSLLHGPYVALRIHLVQPVSVDTICIEPQDG